MVLATVLCQVIGVFTYCDGEPTRQFLAPSRPMIDQQQLVDQERYIAEGCGRLKTSIAATKTGTINQYYLLEKCRLRGY